MLGHAIFGPKHLINYRLRKIHSPKNLKEIISD